MIEATQGFYVKTIFYGGYVKEITIPTDVIRHNLRNQDGVKNLGNNNRKLVSNNIRARGNFIRKVYHNFSNCKELSFLTLTYAVNERNVKKCKRDLAKFFKALSYEKENLKYCYTYEYQRRGAVHFHILMNHHFKNKFILSKWSHGLNKNLRVKENTQENIAKYCSKFIQANYVSKSLTNVKALNQFDLNLKSYQFSYNCKNPVVKKFLSVVSIKNIIDRAVKAEFMKFLKHSLNEFKTRILGSIYDFKLVDYHPYENVEVWRL
ncbi:MAG: rolling circle replication-associated protein [Spiroplasma sp.]